MGKKTGLTVKKVLVRAPNWIGDAVMCLPAIDAVKRLYPEARITVLTRARAVPVFENNPAVAQVLEYSGKSDHRGVGGKLRLVKELRTRGFDAAVLLQNAFDAAFIALLTGIPRRYGYARDFRSLLLTEAVPLTDKIKTRHQIFYYLNLVAAVGGDPAEIDSHPPAPRITLTDAEEAWAVDFYKRGGFSLKDEAFIGVAPGASYGPAKIWPPDRYAEVLTRFSKEHNLIPVVFGGAEDAPSCAMVTKMTGANVINLAGRLSLRQSMSLLKTLKVFLTNDSGAMHISSALGVPTVAVFGSTDPSLTGPVDKKSIVLIKKQPCSPCFKRECRYGSYDCLNSITANEVYSAAQTLLKKDTAFARR